MKRPMPVERVSKTRKFKLGDLEGYITAGLYEDGTPGEVFLTVQSVGSLERGLCHALALMISVALQHGVPLSKVVKKLEGLHFEPAGFTGAKDIPTASSIADYVGKWLRLKFLQEEK